MAAAGTAIRHVPPKDVAVREVQRLAAVFFLFVGLGSCVHVLRGDFTNLYERKLMDCLNRLGYDIEIKVRPASEPVGHLTLATA